jgi:hypothetical protein
MTRQDKISKEIVKRIYANGGHWVELNMKKGGKLIITRKGISSFERLEHDEFDVCLNNNNNRVMHNAELASISNYIIENF